MTGRTCQLCGKPLSRFAVGSGGDFCSREHRNQFRLRLGMDRLQEANKVANLMRRRENAKTIPAAQLARDSKVSPRAAAPLRLPVRAPAVHSLMPQAAVLEPLRISATSRNLLEPRPTPASSEAGPRLLEPLDSFAMRQARMLLPPRREKLPVQIPVAGMASLHGETRSRIRRREVATLGWRLTRTHIGGNGIQVRQAASAIRNCQEPQQALRIASSADRGRDLRVSGGIGFRVSTVKLRPITFSGPRPTALLSSGEILPAIAASTPRDTPPRPAGIRIIAREIMVPKAPVKNGAVHFRWPNAIVPGSNIQRLSAAATRTCDVYWNAGTPTARRLRLDQGNGLRFRTPAPTVAKVSSLPARTIESVHKLALVNFEPQDAAFEWTPTALYGSLVSGSQFGSAPVRKQETVAAPTLEEHFDAGLQDWVGALDDWKVDVAGVRVGSMALYLPSLEITDYLLEFLARIESRSVTWLVRAEDFDRYYEATLAVSPEGGYEFRRHAVVGGVAEPEVTRRVPTGPPSARTAVTLRTRVSGDEFTVSLDGQAIETWTDSRFVTGGIGFVGASDDRARLYWIKLTPAGHFTKEYSKK